MTTLSAFLKSHIAKKNDVITHTRIKKDGVISGCAYCIPDEDQNQFYELVYDTVVNGGKHEYFTEKQRKHGTFYADIDLHYSVDIQTRQHTQEWTKDLICSMLTCMKEFVQFDTSSFPIYVLQKDGVNRTSDKTKDGIHIVFGIKIHDEVKKAIRKRIIETTTDLLTELPLINDAGSVFDGGLMHGTTNCQVIGCRKPDHDIYKPIMICDAIYDTTDNEFQTVFKSCPPIITKDLYINMSVRAGNAVEFPYTPEGQKHTMSPEKKQKQSKTSLIPDIDNEQRKLYECFEIKRIDDYHTWIQIAWATKNTWGDAGLKEFIALNERCPERDNKADKSNAEDFYNDIDVLRQPENMLTKASLHIWAKKDNLVKYTEYFGGLDPALKEALLEDNKIETKNAISEQLFYAIMCMPTDVSIARYFIALFGDNFVCTDIKNKTFYEFNNICIWIRNDGGSDIRNLLSSKKMKSRFIEKLQSLKELLDDPDIDANSKEKYTEQRNACLKCLNGIESNSFKNNYFREIQDLIYKAEFTKDMNKQKYILPIKGKKVLDMRTLKTYERTISHKFDYECDATYRELTPDEDADIEKYFSDLFCGRTDTVQVVLDILKSCFTGETLRYIPFCTGSGRNGKSTLFNVLGAIFSNAMDVISKDLILQKKSNSHLNTEVEKLDRCRLGYTTELKDDDKLNEANIKAITGGDKINVRGIQKTDATLTPTANLWVLTNELPSFKVEPAILARLIIIPFNNTFPVDKNFERDMLDKKELVFCYIMKHGVIRDNFELTDEMNAAKAEYVADNNPIMDFISECYEKNPNGKPVERDEFRREYNNWRYQRGLPDDKSQNRGFTNMVASAGFPSKKSNSKTYYIGLSKKKDFNTTEEESQETELIES